MKIAIIKQNIKHTTPHLGHRLTCLLMCHELIRWQAAFLILPIITFVSCRNEVTLSLQRNSHVPQKTEQINMCCV